MKTIHRNVCYSNHSVNLPKRRRRRKRGRVEMKRSEELIYSYYAVQNERRNSRAENYTTHKALERLT
jgi:hypothetical protein